MAKPKKPEQEQTEWVDRVAPDTNQSLYNRIQQHNYKKRSALSFATTIPNHYCTPDLDRQSASTSNLNMVIAKPSFQSHIVHSHG